LFVSFVGVCKNCVVPLKSCVLCNAYKTVYGKERFLLYRLQKKHNRSCSETSQHSSSLKHDTATVEVW